MTDDPQGLRDKLARQGEEALGKLAQDLLENPFVSNALSRAFEARERAVQAQEAAMGALNLPSAADIERLTRRIRSVAQRLEGIEDGLDRLERRLEGLGQAGGDDRMAGIERQLAQLTSEVRSLAGRSGGASPAAGKAASARKPAARKPAARKPSGGGRSASKP